MSSGIASDIYHQCEEIHDPTGDHVSENDLELEAELAFDLHDWEMQRSFESDQDADVLQEI